MGGYKEDVGRKMQKEDGDSLFTGNHEEKMRGNGHKLLLGRFWLDTREKIFPVRINSHRNIFHRGVVDSPMCDSYKIQLDWVLGHLVWTMFLPGEVGPDNPCSPFQPGSLWSYDDSQNMTNWRTSLLKSKTKALTRMQRVTAEEKHTNINQFSSYTI